MAANLGKPKKKKSDNPFDVFYTPYPLAVAALDLLPPMALGNGGTVLDAGAGAGVWGRAVRSKYGRSHNIGVEIRGEMAQPIHDYDEWYGGADFTTLPASNFAPPVSLCRPEIVLGNPPFGVAVPFVEKALEIVPMGGYVFFLLRASFLGTVARRKFWKANPPLKVWMLTPRPSFTGGGNDTGEYFMYLWLKGANNEETKLSWLNWK